MLSVLEEADPKKFIVAFYWLPVTYVRHDGGGWSLKWYEEHPLYCMRKLKNGLRTIFIGCLEDEIPAEDQPKVEKQLREEFNCFPVFLPKELVSTFYNSFCWKILWPLFHYQVPQGSSAGALPFDQSVWHAYCSANLRFADIVRRVYRDGDLVMINDFHLFLLPTFLRRKNAAVRIAFFMHTPWPSSEIYRTLPYRNEILRGLLNCDILGFQIFDYTRHFLVCCNRLLGLETSPASVQYYGRTVKVLTTHVGIDPIYVQNLLQTDQVRNLAAAMRSRLGSRKVLVGVDNLDHLQGVSLKMLAFECYLQLNPDQVGKVALVQIAIPRADSSQELKNDITRIVGRINHTFGGVDPATPVPKHSQLENYFEGNGPVFYVETTISSAQRFALLSVADALVITSCRDGLNLLPYQYVVCQSEKKQSAMIISEFTGCSRSLSSAFRVNPWASEEVATAIQNALTLSEKDRVRKLQRDTKYVFSHTGQVWASHIVTELEKVAHEDAKDLFAIGLGLDLKIGALGAEFSRLQASVFRKSYLAAQRRLLLLNCDSLFDQNPAAVSEVMDLARDSKNHLVLLSGHDVDWLVSHLATADLALLDATTLVVEHGFAWRPAAGIQRGISGSGSGSGVVTSSVSPTPLAKAFRTFQDVPAALLEWKDEVFSILQTFTERTDGSYVEKKETGMTWHYRDADPDFGVFQAKDLYGHLEIVLANTPTDILFDNKKIEVKLQRCSKAVVVERLLHDAASANSPYDLVLCVGDDLSDESTFALLQPTGPGPHTLHVAQTSHLAAAHLEGAATTAASAHTVPPYELFSCTLSTKPSKAKYLLSDGEELVKLLRALPKDH